MTSPTIDTNSEFSSAAVTEAVDIMPDDPESTLAFVRYERMP
jgi:hypothetical protein